MRDDDSFRLIDRDGAILIVCILLGIVAALFVPGSPRHVTTAQPKPLCEVTVAQYGPGERWVLKPPVPSCAGRMVEVPNHIFTMPVAK